MNELVKLKKKVEIKSWLDKMEVTNYTINKNLTVDVDGVVDLHNKKLTLIPIKFRNVFGDFHIELNHLTCLKGCPSYVGGSFYCSDNNLETLKGCPSNLNGSLYCDYNALKTLEHAPKEPSWYYNNPCTRIYKEYGFNEKTHQRCREEFGL